MKQIIFWLNIMFLKETSNFYKKRSGVPNIWMKKKIGEINTLSCLKFLVYTQ